MKKRELLEKQLDMLEHNLMCYSSDHHLDKPKEGYEEKWKESKIMCELMQEILNQLPHWNSKEFRFIGTVSSWKVGFSKVNNENFIEFLVVSDRDDYSRIFEIGYEVGKEFLNVYDEERHRRYNIEKDTNVVFKVSDTFQKIMSWEWLVK